MSLRFRRSLRIAPGVCLNLGMRGVGLSVGPRGLHVGVNRRGMYGSAGIPGTGLYAVHHFKPTGEPPQVQSNVAPLFIGVLLAVLVVAVLVIAALVLIL